MFRKNHVKHISLVMKRNTKVPDPALLFQCTRSFICFTLFKFLIVVLILCVHQIEIKIFHSTPCKLLLKERPDILLFLKIGICQLIRQQEAASFIPFRHTVPNCSL